MNYKYKGISLIALVITVIILIILSTTTIIFIRDVAINYAVKEKFLSDSKTFQTDLELYINNKKINSSRTFNENLLYADKTSVTYNDGKDTSINITDIIPALKNSTYIDFYEVYEGKLIYKGENLDQKNWAKELDIPTEIIPSEVTETITVDISSPDKPIVQSSDAVMFLLTFSSPAPINSVNLANKIDIVDADGNLIETQPAITIGEVSGTDTSTVRNVRTYVDTTTLVNGNYRLRIKSQAISNTQNNTNNISYISKDTFQVINNYPISEPQIALNRTDISSKVEVTITTIEINSVIQYSVDDARTWQVYSDKFEINENITVYARVAKLNKLSNVVSKKITNIDNTAPKINISSPSLITAKTGDTVTYEVTYTDDNLSDITLSVQDIVLNKISTANANIAVTNSATKQNTKIVTLSNISGEGKLSISILDNTAVDLVGNYSAKSGPSTSFNVDSTIPVSPIITVTPTTWTKNAVTVKIKYSSDTKVGEYSTDLVNWYTYTGDISILNNTTVYARSFDRSGNQSSQSSLIISNIDKLAPLVSFELGGAANATELKDKVIVSDAGTSGLVNSSLLYVWDTQNSVAPTIGWTSFENNTYISKAGAVDGTYYLWIKAADNAGNQVVAKSNAFVLRTVIQQIISISAPSKLGIRAGETADYTVTYDPTNFTSSTLSAADITLNKTGTVNASVLVYGNGNTRTVQIRNVTGEGTISFSIAAGTARDKNGNLVPGFGPSGILVVDNTWPTVNISAPSKAYAKTGDTVTYNITYVDTNFYNCTLTTSGITLNRQVTANANMSLSGTGNTRTLTLSNITGDGSLSISIAYGTATDIAQNGSYYTGPSQSFIVDNTKPTVSISAPSKSSAKLNDTVTYTLTYNDINLNNITLTSADITLNKTATANATVSVSGTGNTRTVTLSNISGEGTLGITVANNTSIDKAGNLGTGATSSVLNVDATPPVITISSPSKAYAKSYDTVTYSITYSDANFDSSNLTTAKVILNKTGTANASINAYGYANNYTVMLSNFTGDGTLSITIAAGTAQDRSGNLAIQTGPSQTIIVDNTPPQISVVPIRTPIRTGEVAEFLVTFIDDNFDSTTLSPSNVKLYRHGGVKGTLSTSGTSNVRLVAISNVTDTGDFTISIDYGVAIDKAGNVSQSFGQSVPIYVIP
ncbi:MAG: hypothetical protein N2749_02950 [Clostridia bacterium]|nr:hypothetical protein [Clostridia bacterium]